MNNEVKAKNKEYKAIIQELRVNYNTFKTIPEDAEENGGTGSPLPLPPKPNQQLNRTGGNSLRQIKEHATGPVSKTKSDYQFSASRPRRIDVSADSKGTALSGGKLARAGSIKSNNKIVHFARDDGHDNSESLQPPEREESVRDDRSGSNFASYYGHVRPKERSVADSGK